MSTKKLEQKIKELEKDNAELKNQLKPFIEEVERRSKFIEKRNEIDGKIAQMMSNFHK